MDEAIFSNNDNDNVMKAPDSKKRKKSQQGDQDPKRQREDAFKRLRKTRAAMWMTWNKSKILEEEGEIEDFKNLAKGNLSSLPEEERERIAEEKEFGKSIIRVLVKEITDVRKYDEVRAGV